MMAAVLAHLLFRVEFTFEKMCLATIAFHEDILGLHYALIGRNYLDAF